MADTRTLIIELTAINGALTLAQRGLATVAQQVQTNPGPSQDPQVQALLGQINANAVAIQTSVTAIQAAGGGSPPGGGLSGP